MAGLDIGGKHRLMEDRKPATVIRRSESIAARHPAQRMRRDGEAAFTHRARRGESGKLGRQAGSLEARQAEACPTSGNVELRPHHPASARFIWSSTTFSRATSPKQACWLQGILRPQDDASKYSHS